jgi:hypothetical protein
MGGYVVNIEDATATNVNYRRVLFTAKHAQLVLMNPMPGEAAGKLRRLVGCRWASDFSSAPMGT